VRRGWRTSALAALALAVALLALPAAALAQCPRTSVGDVEDEVLCPVCGTSLAVATEAQQAQRERRFIFELVEQCKSKDEIKTALAAEFGDSVLALPEDGNSDAAAYLVPAGAGVLAVAALGLALARWRRRGGPASAGAPSDTETTAGRPAGPGAPAAGDSARLDADLDRYNL